MIELIYACFNMIVMLNFLMHTGPCDKERLCSNHTEHEVQGQRIVLTHQQCGCEWVLQTLWIWK